MALTKTERGLLKRARSLIASGQERYICNALYRVACERPRLREASDRLRAYIHEQLYPAITLEQWQTNNRVGVGFPSRDRLAWIDWMLDEGGAK